MLVLLLFNVVLEIVVYVVYRRILWEVCVLIKRINLLLFERYNCIFRNGDSEIVDIYFIINKN